MAEALLQPFWADPEEVQVFIDTCVAQGTPARFRAFLRAWSACGALQGDERTWRGGVNALPMATPAAANLKRELLTFLNISKCLCLPGTPTRRISSLWREFEDHLDPTRGACAVFQGPTASDEILAFLEPVAAIQKRVRIVDKFAVSKHSSDGLQRFLARLARCGVTAVELHTAYEDVRGRGRTRDQAEAKKLLDDFRAMAGLTRLDRSLHPLSSMGHTVHDRFIAFTNMTSDAFGVAIQLGPGVGVFTTPAPNYPITVSRVPFGDFRTIWDALRPVRSPAGAPSSPSSP